MAAAGDSITVGYNASGYGSFPQYSWSTGTYSTLNSLYQRLVSASATAITAVNVAVVGANSGGLSTQVDAAIGAGADYLTVEIGANDACTPTPDTMTSVEVYRDRIKSSLVPFLAAQPTNEVFIASIPSLYKMWSVSKSKFGARLIWASASVCQSMLKNPSSTNSTDEARRVFVQTRVDDYNKALAAVCVELGARCTFDNNAVAKYTFTSTHISTADYFHPSIAGQRVLAEVTWPYNPYPSG